MALCCIGSLPMHVSDALTMWPRVANKRAQYAFPPSLLVSCLAMVNAISNHWGLQSSVPNLSNFETKTKCTIYFPNRMNMVVNPFGTSCHHNNDIIILLHDDNIYRIPIWCSVDFWWNTSVIGIDTYRRNWLNWHVLLECIISVKTILYGLQLFKFYFFLVMFQWRSYHHLEAYASNIIGLKMVMNIVIITSKIPIKGIISASYILKIWKNISLNGSPAKSHLLQSLVLYFQPKTPDWKDNLKKAEKEGEDQEGGESVAAEESWTFNKWTKIYPKKILKITNLLLCDMPRFQSLGG